MGAHGGDGMGAHDGMHLSNAWLQDLDLSICTKVSNRLLSRPHVYASAYLFLSMRLILAESSAVPT